MNVVHQVLYCIRLLRATLGLYRTYTCHANAVLGHMHVPDIWHPRAETPHTSCGPREMHVAVRAKLLRIWALHGLFMARYYYSLRGPFCWRQNKGTKGNRDGKGIKEIQKKRRPSNTHCNMLWNPMQCLAPLKVTLATLGGQSCPRTSWFIYAHV